MDCLTTFEENDSLIYSDSLDFSTSDNNNILLYSYIDSCNFKTAYFLAIILALGNAADAVEIICVGYIMAVLEDVSAFEKECLSASVFAGMLLGGLICGYLSDIIGRKPCLLFSLGINAIAGILSCFSPNVIYLIVFRVLAGIGIGGSVPSVFTLGSEIFPTAIRGKLLSIIASFWMVGSIFVALVAWLMLGNNFEGKRIAPGVTWRAFAAVSALPAFLAFILCLIFVPESPRYLISKHRVKDAIYSLRKMKANLPLNLNSIQRISNTRQTSDISSFSSTHSDSPAVISFLQMTSPSILCTSSSLKIVTLILSIVWFTLSFGSYGVSTWITLLFAKIGLTNPFADTFIFALANLPGNICSIFLIDWLGRKRLLSWGMCLAALSAVGFASGASHRVVVVTCSALFNAFSVVAWNSLDCMSVELFPTSVRSTAMGVLAATGRIGAITAQFVNGSLMSNIPRLLLVTSLCMVVGGVSVWALPADGMQIALQDSIDVNNDLRTTIINENANSSHPSSADSNTLSLSEFSGS